MIERCAHMRVIVCANSDVAVQAHLRQGQLRYDAGADTFTRSLDEATAMVMSPVQLSAPNDPRYPLFKRVRMFRYACARVQGVECV